MGQAQHFTWIIGAPFLSDFQDIPEVFLCDLFPNYSQQNKPNYFQIE
jgi:hypothetical protein